MKLQDSEPKPKRPRKKTKPSALTRPPKKGKKKKNQRKITRPQKPLPPELPTGDTGMAFNSIALRMAKIIYNFGLSECNRVKM